MLRDYVIIACSTSTTRMPHLKVTFSSVFFRSYEGRISVKTTNNTTYGEFELSFAARENSCDNHE